MDFFNQKQIVFKLERILFYILSIGIFVTSKSLQTSANPNYADSVYTRNYNTQQNESFDFIVIGSGPSGAVIANRLSEVPEWNVLLLEAGEEATILSDIPAVAGWIGFTDLNWGYKAERQSGFCQGIPVIANLPVGQKIYDHATFVGVTFQLNQSTVYPQNEIFTNPIPTLIDFLKRGRGPLASLGVEALAYIKTNESTDSTSSSPDLELIFVGGGISSDGGAVFRRMFNIPQETYDIVWKPLENEYVYQVYPMWLHPQSYGYMKLKSKNPLKWPQFYANYLSDLDDQDIRTLIAAIREIQRINESPSFQRYGATLVSTPIPGCENQIFDSDDYWECSLRQLIGSLHHQVGACKMGPEHDPEAVVDHKLRVHGIGNLRVADTSIIPLTLAAHTATPSYMIGEKAADIIKEEWMSNSFA